MPLCLCKKLKRSRHNRNLLVSRNCCNSSDLRHLVGRFWSGGNSKRRYDSHWNSRWNGVLLDSYYWLQQLRCKQNDAFEYKRFGLREKQRHKIRRGGFSGSLRVLERSWRHCHLDKCNAKDTKCTRTRVPITCYDHFVFIVFLVIHNFCV